MYFGNDETNTTDTKGDQYWMRQRNNKTNGSGR